MIDRHKAYHLLGESLRDIGILVVVFGPLDAFFQGAPTGIPVMALIILCGLLFTVVGIIIEAQE